MRSIPVQWADLYQNNAWKYTVYTAIDNATRILEDRHVKRQKKECGRKR